MTLHIPSWIVYIAFYGVAGSAFLLLVTFAVYAFHKSTVERLRNAKYYCFARCLMWSHYKREGAEKNFLEVLDFNAEELREEDPKRFRMICSRLNFGTNLEKGERITKAVQAYLADPEHQKRSDMESVIIEVLEAA